MSPPTPEEEQRRIENLRAVLAGMRAGQTRQANPSTAPSEPAKPHGTAGRKTLWGSLTAGAVFLLGKFELLALLGGVLKLKTLATMLISIAV